MRKTALLVLSVILVFVSSIAYSALSTSLSITSEVKFRRVADIRVNGVSLNNSNNATIAYESEYSKDTVSNGFTLPSSGSSISYTVHIDNSGDVDYAIYDIFKTSSDNGLLVNVSGYNLRDVIPAKESIDLVLTYTTTNPSQSVINVVNTFDFKRVFYVDYVTGTSQIIPRQVKYQGVNLALTSTVPTKTGYTFSKWNDKSDGTGINYTSGANYVEDEDATLYARYTLDTYTITYVLNGGTNNQNNPATYTYETNDITLGDASKTGYTFNGWTGNGTTTATKNLVLPKHSTGNKTFTANFTANTYTINYTMNGGNNPSTKPTSGTYDANVVISNPTKTVTITPNVNGTGASIGSATSAAQTFQGWTSTTIGNNAKTGSTSSNYATWNGTTATTNTYFKNLKESGSVTMVANWTPVAVTLPTLTKSGYTCKWYTDPTNGTEMGLGGASWTPNSNSSQAITAYARCTANTYTVTANANGGSIASTTGWTGTGNTATKSVTYNSTYGTLPTVSRDGYTFKGWNGKNKYVPTTKTLTYNGITLDYDVSTGIYTLNGSAKNNSSVPFVLVPRGDISLPAGNYVFKTEYVSGNYTFPNASYASLSVFCYGSTTYNLVSSGIITSNGISNTNVYNVNTTSDNYIAGFYINPYVSGTVTSNWSFDNFKFKIQLEEGTTATPSEPYYISDTTNVTTPRNHDINAIWERNNYTITYALNNGTNNENNPASYNVESSAITLQAPTKTITFKGNYNATSAAYAASGSGVIIGSDTTATQTFSGWNESITNLMWIKGFIDLNTGALTTNSSYPNSYYTSPIKLKSGVQYTLSGFGSYATGGIRWRLYNTDGTYWEGTRSSATYTPTKDCYVRILFYNNPTAEQLAGTILTGGTTKPITIPTGSTGDRNYTAHWTAVAPAALPTVTRPGYICGWASNSNGTTIQYASGATNYPTNLITDGTSSTVNLYAVCKNDVYTLTLNTNGGSYLSSIPGGKNLVNVSDYTNTPVATIRANENSKVINVDYKPLTQYTVSATVSASSTNTTFGIYVGYTNGTYDYLWLYKNGTVSPSVTTAANKTVHHIEITYGTGANVTMSNFQLEEGATATTYEPYVAQNTTTTTTRKVLYDYKYNNDIGIPTRTGYTFDGWYTASNGGTQVYGSNGRNVNASGYWSAAYSSGVWKYANDVTLYAHWSKAVSTLNNTLSATDFIYNGSTQGPTLTVKDGSTTLTSGTDYTASGLSSTNVGQYSVTITGSNTYNSTTKAYYTGTTTLTYNINNAQLTFDKGSCASVSGTTPLYTKKGATGVYTGIRNTTAGTIPTASKSGYTFSGWYTASTGGNKVLNANGTFTSSAVSGYTNATSWQTVENKTLYAQCTRDSYTISYTMNNGTNNANNPTGYNVESSAITLQAPTKTLQFVGHVNAAEGANASSGLTIGPNTSQAQTFAGWTGSNGSTAQTSVTIPTGSTGNKSYTAHWTAVAGTVPTVTKVGYTCGWSTTAGTTIEIASGGSYATSRITEGMSTTVNLYAVCTPNTYKITYDYRNNVYDSNPANWRMQGNTHIDENNQYNGKQTIAIYSNETAFTGLKLPTNNDKKQDTNYKMSLYAKRTGSIDGSLRVYATTFDSSNNVINYNVKILLTNDNMALDTWGAYTGTFNSDNYAKWDWFLLDYNKANQGPVYVSDLRLDEYEEQSKVYGNTLGTLPTPTRTGYTFAGWYTTAETGGTQISSSTAIPSADTTYYARWTPDAYTITYALNNGTVSPENPTSYNIETPTFALTNPTKTLTFKGNYNATSGANAASGQVTIGSNTTAAQTFAGWTGSNGSTAQTSVTIPMGSTGDKSYTARWTAVAGTVPTVTRTGYTCGWSTSSTGTTIDIVSGGSYATSRITEGMSATVNLYAVCVSNVYEITLNKQNGSNGTSTIYEKYNTGYYLNNSNGTVSNQMTTSANGITVPTRTGYTFAGYYTSANGGTQYIDANGKLTSSASTTQFTTTGTLYAKWTKAVSNLTNSVSPTSYIYDGTAKTPTETVKDGNTTLVKNTDYTITFTNNTNVGTATATITGANVYNSTTKAYYTGTTTVSYYINNAQLTFNVGSCESISGSTTLYTKKGATGVYQGIRNTTAGTIPTSSKTGYTFNGWYTASTGGSKVLNANGTFTGSAVSGYTNATSWQTISNQTLYAQCTPTSYTLTANAASGTIASTTGWTGTGASATKSVAYDSAYGTLPTISRAGYTFQGWSILPAGYTQVEYIQFSGSQYINTNLLTKQSLKIESEFSTTTVGTLMFGGRTSTSLDSITFGYFTNDTSYVGFGGNTYSYATTINLINGEKHKVVLSKDIYKIDGEDQNITNRSTLSNFYNIYLGTWNNAGTADSRMYQGKIYNFVVYDEETLVRYMVPCINDSTGKAGMYDLVNGVFYGSATNTDLTAGNATYITSETIVNIPSDHTIYAKWADETAPTIVSVTPTTTLDIRNYVDFNATDEGTGIVGYNITSTNTAPTTWIPVVSAVETATETKYQYDAAWARVFHHNSHYATVLFNSANSWAEAKSSNTIDKYSVLGNLANYKNSTNWEFLLQYPDYNADKYNRWKQTSNPATTNNSVTGYEAVHIDWAASSWNGMAISSDSSSTFIDGSPAGSGWYYAIGAANKFYNGIPGPTAASISNVNLWARIDNLENTTTANLTRRIGDIASNGTYYVWLKDAAGNTSSTTVTINKVDRTKPTTSITSTNNVATSQTATLTLGDNNGVVKYSWGTANPTGNTTITWTNITSTASTTIDKTISADGTYYLAAQDAAGNWNVVNKTFYKTTLNANDGSVSPANVVTMNGNSFTLPNPTRTGYDFAGWYTDSGLTTAVTLTDGKYKPTTNTTLYAKWTGKTYTLTIEPNGGSYSNSTNASTKTMRYGSTDNNDIGIPTREGYTFDGWYTAANGGTQVYGSNGQNVNATTYWTAAYSTGTWKYTGALSVYAHWSKAVSTLNNTLSAINFIYNGSAQGPTLTVKDGSTTLTSGTDYTASGLSSTNVGQYSVTITGSNAYNSTTKAYYTGTTTLTYNINNAQLTFDKGSCTSVSGTATLYTKKGATGVYQGIRNTTAGTIPTASKSGYVFQGWYTASTGGSKVLNANGTFTGTAVSGYTNATSWQTVENKTLYAQCTRDSYTISYTMNNGTNNANNPTSYNVESSAITLQAPTKTLTFKGNYNATSGANAASGTVTIGADTTAAQTFAGWTGSNGSTAQTSVTIPTGSTGDKSYTAHWTAVAGTVPTVTRTGYTCGWSTSSTGTTIDIVSGGSYGTDRITEEMSATVNLYAVCVPNVYEITLNKQNGSNGTSTIYEKYNTGYYLNNSNGTVSNQMSTSANGITVPTRSGYTFAGYYTSANGGTQYIDANGKLTSSASTTQFTTTGTLYAKWTKAVSNLTNTVSPTSYIYDGTAKTPTETVKDGSTTLTKNTDYTVSGLSNTAVGQYNVTITGSNTYNSTTKAYYTGTTTVSYYINNAQLTFDKGSCASVSGTTPLYTKKGATVVYTGIRETTTTGTIPTGVPVTGYKFDGWYTASTGGSKVLNANGTFTGTAVTNYTTASAWNVTANQTLYARCSIASYTLTINPAGGSFNGTTSNTTVTQNYLTTYDVANNATKAASVFNGWQLSSGNGNITYFVDGEKLKQYVIDSTSATMPSVYNNKGNGSVTLTNIVDATSSTGYSMKIETNGVAAPNAGGFVNSTNSSAGVIYYHKIVAKVPVGYSLAMHNNAIGIGARNYWITSNAGTGNWETYIYAISTGYNGAFSSFGYVSVTGSNNTSVTWYVNESTIYRKGTNLATTQASNLTFQFLDSNATLTALWGTSGSRVTWGKQNGVFGDGTVGTSWTASATDFTYQQDLSATKKAPYYISDSDYAFYRTGYTFGGWYTAADGGTQIFDSEGKLNASVSGYSDANRKWLKYDENVTLYAKWTKEVSTLSKSVSPTSYIYDGSAKTPTPSVSDGATALTKDTDYTIAYANNTNVGTATATITGANVYNATTKAYYTGTTTVSYYINNAQLTFDKGSCTNVSGTATLYTKKGATGVYQGIRNTTAGTIPTASKSGYVFQGWYTASTGGTKVLNANGTFTGSAVSGYTNATSWQTVENKTLYAQCTRDSYSISYTMNNGTNNANNPASYNVESSAITLQAPTKTLTFKGNYNATSGANAASGTVTIGADTTAAQTFAGWTGSNGSTAQTSVTIPTGSTGDKSYTAHWTAVAGTVPTVTRTGYTCGWSTSSTGTTIEIASGGSYATSRITEGMSATVNLYAVCVANVYEITLNKQNGSNGTSTIYEKYNTGYYLNNSNGTVSNQMSTSANGITVPTRTGYTFAGYYTSANGGTQYIDANGKLTSSASTTQFTTAGTLYAKWTKAVADLNNTLSATNFIYNGSAQGPTLTVKDGSTTLTNNTDYTVSGLSNTNVGQYNVTITGKGVYNSTTKAYYTGETTLTYNINNAQLTFNIGSCDNLTGTTPLYTKKGATVVYTGIRNTTAGTIPTASKSGYTFSGWYTASTGGTKVLNANGTFTGSAVSGYTNATSWQTISNQALYAQCTRDSYTISYTMNNGTNNANNPTSYNVESSAITLQAPTKTLIFHGNVNATAGANANTLGGANGITIGADTTAEQRFAGWTGSNGSTAQTTVTIPTGSTGDKSYTAHWQPDPTNHPIVLPTVTKTGYECGWSTSASGTSIQYASGATDYPTSAITESQAATVNLYAVCTPSTYTVTANANGGTIASTEGWNGTGSTATKSVTYNSAYGTIPTPTRSGYTFNGWNGKNLLNINDLQTYSKWSSSLASYGNYPTTTSNPGYLLNLESGETYTISYTTPSSSEFPPYFYLCRKTSTTTSLVAYLTTDSIANTVYTFTAENGYEYYLRAAFSTESVFNERLSKISTIQLEKSSSVTEYEPYYITSSTVVTRASDHTLYAHWSKAVSTLDNTLSTTSYIYNGSAKSPTATVKDGNTTLTNNTDYTVSYSNNTNVGTATATITGKNITNNTTHASYTGTTTLTYYINNAELTFNAGTCESISGTTTLYTRKGATAVYTGIRETTATGTIPTASKSGYTFQGWYTAVSGGSKVLNANRTFTGTAVSGYTTASAWDVTENKTLYARCSANTYTVTANANGGTISSTSGWTGTGNTATKSVTYNAAYGTLPTVSRSGYAFQGWSLEQQEDKLPAGYTQVEYIQSTGNQYMNLNYILHKEQKAIARLEFTTLGNQAIFGTYTGNYIETFGLSGPSKWEYRDAKSGWVSSSTYATADTLYDVELYYGSSNQYLKVNGTTVIESTAAHTNNVSSLPAFLLSRNYGGAQNYSAKAKLYSFKLYDGDTLVRDMVPCINDSTDEAGMYDLVNGVFYGNEGTGDFTAGSITYITSEAIVRETENHTIYAVWKDETLPTIASATPSTTLDLRNYVDFNATDAGSGIVGYNITSTNEQPTTWIPVVSVVDATTETKYEYDAAWARVFHHNNHFGSNGTHFANATEAASITNNVNKYSVLGSIADYKNTNNWEFLLQYPGVSSTQYNRWTQTLSPLTASGTAVGYTAVGTPSWTGTSFAGISLSSNSGRTYMDGSPTADTWYYAIGTYSAYGDGMPGPNGALVGTVNLWSRIDNLTTTTSNNLTRRIGDISSDGTYYVWVKDAAGNISSTQVTVNKVDTTVPTATITSTNDVATSQTVTLTLGDNKALDKYYWGTTNAGSANVSYTAISDNPTTYAPTKSVTTNGTYYVSAVDKAGNKYITNKVFYKTTLNANGGSVSPANVVTMAGNSFTLPEPTKSGYDFAGWYTDEELTTAVTLTNGKYTPSTNATLYAKYDAGSYTITYTMNDGTNNANNPSNYSIESSDITLSAPTRSGYTFNGWSSNNLFDKNATPYQTGSYIKGGGALVENGEYNVYQVSVNPNTSYTIVNSGQSSSPGYAIYNESGTRVAGDNYLNVKVITFTTPANASYIRFSVVSRQGSSRYDKNIFELYETNGLTSTYSTYVTKTIPTGSMGNKTFTANWSKAISDLTITLSQDSYIYDGSAKTPTVTVKDGSTTLTKNTDYTVSYSNNTNVGTATITITAVGAYNSTTKATYTGTTTRTYYINNAQLTFDKGSCTSVSGTATLYTKKGATSVYQGIRNTTAGTIPTGVAGVGQAFDGWYTAASGGSKVLTSTNGFTGSAVSGYTTGSAWDTTENKTLYAHCPTDNNTVIYNCSENGGTGTIANATVAFGQSINLPSTGCTKSGYTFLGWNTDKNETTTLSSLTMGTGEVTLYAIYRHNTAFTATFTANNGATVTPASASCYRYNKQTTCTVNGATVTAQSGFTHIGFNTSASSTSNNSNYNLGTNKLTLSGSGTWYPITSATWTGTFNIDDVNAATGGGTATCTRYNGAGSCTITAKTLTAKPDYEVVGWNTTRGATSATVSSGQTGVTLTGNTTYWSVTRTSSVVTITFNPNTTNSKVTSQTHAQTGTVTISSTPNTVAVTCQKYNGGGSCNVTSPTMATTAGYHAVGYNTTANATTSTWNVNTAKEVSSSTTYYAITTANTYSIHYNANCPSGTTASGSMSNLSMTYGQATNLTANAYGCTNREFKGWTLSADGSGTVYQDQASVSNLTTTNGGTVELYAKWRLITPTPTISGGTTKIYGSSATTLTCTENTTTYPSGYTKYYSFGYATSANGTPENWSTASQTATKTIAANEYVGVRYYACRVYVQTSSEESDTAVSSKTAMTIKNAKITFDAGSCGTISGTNPAYVNTSMTGVYTGATNVTAGTIPSTSKNGYVFNGWYDGSTMVINGNGTIASSVSGWTASDKKWLITTDKTLTASCTRADYTISYSMNYGTNNSNNPLTYHIESAAITLQQPTKTLTFKGNYNATAGANASSESEVIIGANTTAAQTFAGWTGSNGNTAQTSVTIASGSTGNKNYTAHWTAVAPEALPTVTREGYECGWSTSSSGTSIQYASGATNYPVSAITESQAATVNLYAVCETDSYVITLDKQGGSGGTGTIYENYSVGYYLDAAQTNQMTTSANGITIPTKTNYVFDGYYTEADGGVEIITSTGKLASGASTTQFSEDGTLYARWVPSSYTITYVLNGGTAENPASYTSETPTFTLTRPERVGYTFAGWTGTGLSAATLDVEIAIGSTGNRTYTATWTANSYNLNLNSLVNSVIVDDTSACGTADIYINGNLVSNDVTDYNTAWPTGTTYTISDIKATTGSGCTYIGETSYTGTIIGANVEVNIPYTFTSRTFTYTGGMQSFKVPASGSYRLEVWGAQGGTSSSHTGGLGGYTNVSKCLTGGTSGETLYVGVGGTTTTYVGGFNGGNCGNGWYAGDCPNYASTDYTHATTVYAAGGGGATHIGTVNDVLYNYTSDQRNPNYIFAVAGGGGGGSEGNNGGAGGKLNGTNGGGSYGGKGGSSTTSTGGAGGNGQTSANGEFGLGGHANKLGAVGSGVSRYWAGGGGGGLYGGGGGDWSTSNSQKSYSGGGGGGSGTQGLPGYPQFGGTGTAGADGVREGNGQAIITWEGECNASQVTYHDITLDYNINQTFTAPSWMNTYYTPDWSKSFDVDVTFTPGTTGKRYMIFSNYDTSATNAIALEVNTSNQLRISVGNGSPTVNTAFGSVTIGTANTVHAEWNANTGMLTITTSDGATGSYVGYIPALVGTGARSLKFGAFDYREGTSNVFTSLNVSNFVITEHYASPLTSAYTLPDPAGHHLLFDGWTGSNGTTPQYGVTLATGATSDVTYTANWSPGISFTYYNSGSYNTSNQYIKYYYSPEISYIDKARRVAYAQAAVRFYRTNDYSTKYSGSITVSFNGSSSTQSISTSQVISLNSNTVFWKIYWSDRSNTYEPIYYEADGTKTVSFKVTSWNYNYSLSGSNNYTFSLPSIGPAP